MLAQTTRITFIVWIAASSWTAHAACGDRDRCPDPGTATAATAGQVASIRPIPVAEFPAEALPGTLAQRGDGGNAGATLRNLGAEAHSAGALIVRAGEGVGGPSTMARAERKPAEPAPAAPPEPSAWIMLLAALAFVGVIVGKRSRG